MTATATQKIHVVTDVRNKSSRLVRALSKAAARRYVVGDSIRVRLASPDDLAELLPRGVQIENVSLDATSE